MSTKDARNEARMLNIAVALLSSEDPGRVKVEAALAVESIDLAIKVLLTRRDAIHKLTLYTSWSNVKPFLDRARVDERQELLRRKDEERSHKQRFGTAPSPQAMAFKITKERDDRRRLRSHIKHKRMVTMAKIGEVVVSMFDSVKVGGHPVGDLWYSQLEGLRNKGAFEAALCQAILHHGKPAKDAQVKDLITEAVLAKFVADANRAVNRVKAAA